MAFLNFLIESSYSRVENIFYNKSNKQIRFSLAVYKKEGSELKLYQNIPYDLINISFRTIKIMSKTTDIGMPNFKAKSGDIFIVPQNVTPSFSLFGNNISTTDVINKLVSYQNNQFVLDSQLNNLAIKSVWVEDEQKYFKFIDGSWVETTELFSPKDWDTYFSLEALKQEGSDPLKACYLWLKTLPYMVNVQSDEV